MRQSIPIIRETLLSHRPKASSRAVAICSLLILLLTSEIYWRNLFGLAAKMAAIPERVFASHEYWRLFTAIFAHSDTEHYLGNAISLGLLAYLLNGYFGSVVYPVGTLFLGAVANLLSLITYPEGTHLVGASGVIYVMAGFWLSVYFFTDRRFSLGSRLVRVTGFAFVLLVPSTIHRGVSYRTHAFGFFLGMIYGVIYFFMNKKRIRAQERVEYEESADANAEPGSPVWWN